MEFQDLRKGSFWNSAPCLPSICLMTQWRVPRYPHVHLGATRCKIRWGSFLLFFLWSCFTWEVTHLWAWYYFPAFFTKDIKPDKCFAQSPRQRSSEYRTNWYFNEYWAAKSFSEYWVSSTLIMLLLLLQIPPKGTIIWDLWLNYTEGLIFSVTVFLSQTNDLCPSLDFWL